jgi:hypothetical protein
MENGEWIKENLGTLINESQYEQEELIGGKITGKT